MKSGLCVRLHAVSVRRANRWALKEVCWDLGVGQRWLLTGANGAGKTQLLKLVAGDVWPTPTGRERVEYRLGAKRIESSEAKALIAYLGAERQDRYARYGWNPTVVHLLATGLHGSDILLAEVTPAQHREIAHMLRRCALTVLATRKFLSLSYGQQRLALLARALIGRPRWLLLDEFYNGLDAVYRRKANAVLSAARRSGQSWVVVAHRSIDVPRGTGWLLRLDQGRVAELKPLQRRELKTLDAARAKTTRSGASLPLPPSPVSLRPGSPRPKTRSDAVSVVRIVNADLYINYRPVLRHINWELRRGEHWAVVGANGAGKSCFLKLLYGDLSPAQGGTIEREGLGRGEHIENWKRRVGYISAQLQSDYAIDSSVEELVASGRHASVGLNHPMTAADRRIVRRWLDHFELTRSAQAKPRELSYGELRRALFARAMAASADVLLFDEPLTGLDPEQRVSMRRRLAELMQRDVSVVMAIHHREDLPAGITHCLHLHNRKIRAEKLRYAT